MKQKLRKNCRQDSGTHNQICQIKPPFRARYLCRHLQSSRQTHKALQPSHTLDMTFISSVILVAVGLVAWLVAMAGTVSRVHAVERVTGAAAKFCGGICAMRRQRWPAWQAPSREKVSWLLPMQAAATAAGAAAQNVGYGWW